MFKVSRTAGNQNGDINVLKFLFSIMIVLLHLSVLWEYPEWQGGWILVEWFFVFAGYTVTQHIYRTEPLSSPGTETVSVVLKRIGSFFPYLIAAAVIALGLRLAAGQIVIGSLSELPELLPDPLMLQMFGFEGKWYIGITWYLGALWVSIALLYPALRKFKGTFDRVYAFLIPLFIYGWFDQTYGCMWSPGTWTGFFCKGMLRGIAGICLGAVSYNIGLYLKKKIKFTKKLEIAVWIVYALLAVLMYKWDDSPLYYLFPFLFAVLISATMNNEHTLFPDTKLTRKLGKLSLLLFLTHYSWIDSMKVWFAGYPRSAVTALAFSGAFVSAVIVGLIGDRLKLLWNRFFNL